MTGFPGESERDHERTMATAKKAAFARAHVFVFSPRPGTEAEGFADRVPVEVARRRSAELRSLAAESAGAFAGDLAGTTAQVLGETLSAGKLEGFCGRYQRVRFDGTAELLGRLANIYIIGKGGGESQTLEGVFEGVVEAGS
jgi:tRNA A37 methylthiotransferase MiaB